MSATKRGRDAGDVDPLVWTRPAAAAAASAPTTAAVLQKRRSLMRGRRSNMRSELDIDLQHEETEFARLCPQSLPPDARLRAIVKHSAELAIKEFGGLTGENTRTKCTLKLALAKTLDELTAEGAFELATMPHETTESDKTVQTYPVLEKKIQESEAYLERLTAESKRWDEILAEHTKTQSEPHCQSDFMRRNASTATQCREAVQKLNVSTQRIGIKLKNFSQVTETLCHINELLDEQLAARVDMLDDGRSVDCKQLAKDILNDAKTEGGEK